MRYLSSWLILPGALLVASLGCGLLISRLAALRPGRTTIPLGYAAAIALAWMPYALGLGSAFGAAWLVGLTAVGLWIGRKDLREALPNTPTMLVMLGIYLYFMAPVFATGQTGFLGYLLLGDTSVNFSIIDYVSQHGSRIVALPDSSYTLAAKQLLEAGYPLGQHTLLASLRQLVTGDIGWIYQPFIATTAAIAVVPLAQILRKSGAGRKVAALGGGFALAAYLPYSFSLQGSMKEFGIVIAVATLALVLAELTTAKARTTGVQTGVLAAAGLAIYNSGAAPWFLFAVATGIVITGAWRRSHLRTTASAAGIAVGVGLVAAFPPLIGLIRFFGQGSKLLGDEAVANVGNLLGPLSWRESLGFWFSGDYRVGSGWPRILKTLDAIALGLATTGVIVGVARRHSALIIYAVACIGAWVAIPAGVYIEAKLLVVMSTAVVPLVVVGLLRLREAVGAPLACATAALLAVAVIASGLAAFHNAFNSPDARMEELRAIGQDPTLRGPTLLPEFEEWGKHYLRPLQPNTSFDGYATRGAALREPGSTFNSWLDIDAITLEYFDDYATLVQRRSPAASRPPASFRLVRPGNYYDVWQRVPGTTVLEHLPLGKGRQATGTAKCEDISKLADQATRDNAKLVAAERPPGLAVRPADLDHPKDWPSNPLGDLQFMGSGTATGKVPLPATGRYQAWIGGDLWRGASLSVDGVPVGTADDAQNPGGTTYIGSFDAKSEVVSLALSQPADRGGPGDGRPQVVKSIYLVKGTRSKLITVPPNKASSLCDRPLDWVEVVKQR